MNYRQEALIFESELAAANTRQIAAEESLNNAIAAGSYHVLYQPRISIDGDQWCALYGENLQDGVAGFGNSPAEAMAAFDRAWVAILGTQEARGGDD